MTTPLTPAATTGPSDFARLKRGRRMPIQFHADLAAEIYSGLAWGLFAYIAMLRDGEEFSIRQIQRTHEEGRDAWSGALAEVLDLELVARVRWADGRGGGGRATTSPRTTPSTPRTSPTCARCTGRVA